jgi:general secretion pathway protein G
MPALTGALAGRGPRRARSAGFTLLELMVVVSVIMILVSVSVPSYQQHVKLAREAALREDLYLMRMAIAQYGLDKLRAPQSIDELVTGGYLAEVPRDPITNSRQTWVVVEEDPAQSIDPDQPGISDVHSGSPLLGTNGSPYSSW